MADPEQTEHVTQEQLRRFKPFAELEAGQLSLLCKSLEVHTSKPRNKIVELGSNDSLELFLLDGKLGLEARDGKKSVILSSSESATVAIAKMRPRMYSIITLSEVKYLLIEPALLKAGPAPVKQASQSISSDSYQVDILGDNSGYQVDILDDDGSYEADQSEQADEYQIDEIYFSIGSDLKNDKLPLPSLPDVAVRIHGLIESESANAETIANAVNSDPAIAAKLLKTANSPLYRGASTFESTQAAIVRLGLGTTRQLITTFAMRSVFQSDNPLLNEHMNRIWKHSIDVASLTYVLARINRGLNPEQALLAGLLHDVGDIAIIAYAESHPYMLANEDTLTTVMDTMRSEIGSMILRKWEFPTELSDAAEKAEEWMNAGSLNINYADLVVLAQLHLGISTGTDELPDISSVPAFFKLKNQTLTEDGKLSILDEAEEQIAEVRQLLTS
ncbi:MAG: HDOD domain-containing protein [Pseudomonadales bacterium]|nr:HDOD domain-containing protein [Pseudomonadales bacterium]